MDAIREMEERIETFREQQYIDTFGSRENEDWVKSLSQCPYCHSWTASSSSPALRRYECGTEIVRTPDDHVRQVQSTYCLRRELVEMIEKAAKE
jgi:hypothetical protein